MLVYLKKVRRKVTRWWWVYCDRQPQQEEGITGTARGRRRRWRTRNKVEDVFGGAATGQGGDFS